MCGRVRDRDEDGMRWSSHASASLRCTRFIRRVVAPRQRSVQPHTSLIISELQGRFSKRPTSTGPRQHATSDHFVSHIPRRGGRSDEHRATSARDISFFVIAADAPTSPPLQVADLLLHSCRGATARRINRVRQCADRCIPPKNQSRTRLHFTTYRP